jgi:hypothetical protein
MGTTDDPAPPDRWGMRHAPELAEPGEDGDVWMLTFEGDDVPGADSYGRGFTAGVVEQLNADERLEASSDG